MSGFCHGTTVHSLRAKREKPDFCYFQRDITETLFGFPLYMGEWNVFSFSFHPQGVYNGVQGVYLTVTNFKSLKIPVDFIWSYPNYTEDFLISMNQLETPWGKQFFFRFSARKHQWRLYPPPVCTLTALNGLLTTPLRRGLVPMSLQGTVQFQPFKAAGSLSFILPSSNC